MGQPTVPFKWHDHARVIAAHHRLLMLVGEPGVGKTVFAKHLAQEKAGRPAVMLRGTPKTDLVHIWGGRVIGSEVRTEFADGPLPRSLKQGRWLVVEEMNLIPMETRGYLLDLRGEEAIENPITGEVLPISRNWRLIATANPESIACYRHGSIAQALLDDFMIIDIDDLDEKTLNEMLKADWPHASSRLLRETIQAWAEFRQIGGDQNDDVLGDKSPRLNFRSASHYLRLRLAGLPAAAATRYALVNSTWWMKIATPPPGSRPGSVERGCTDA